MRGFSRFNFASIFLGLAFLYAPILILVIYSFNDSKLVTLWGGWSTRWYGALLEDEAMLNAAWTTLRLALISATAATVLGTMAAVALVRFGRFRGRSLFSGFWTIVLAHITFSMCYVAIVIQSRLSTFDRSLEEAAMDLGCKPFKTFMVITLPIILPAVIAGWMLGFTLSLDDLVIASFTTGPGATTLPMKIYSQVRLGVTPEINAVCTILIVLVSTGVVIASIFSRRREAERQRAERMAAAGG
jgi:putrescine transport system permease protein